ncbi:MAG TPA: hypothetical protein VFT12_11475 [Thermoanaerobaculia bacterium]|nr:hypothetical protein [Thermoanaerobaculia bacterium]
MRLQLTICLLAAFSAGASTLDDINAALRPLEGKQPIRATFGVQQQVKSAGRYANDTITRTAAADIAADASGLTVTMSQAFLAQATEDEIGAIQTIPIVEALNFRDPMTTLLKGAKVEQEKRVVFRGKAARLLTLKLSTEPRKERNSITIGSVKSDDRMNLWIGDDNLPIAAERDRKTSAGIMFVRGTFTSEDSYTFARAGDRLVLTRLESKEGGSGMGQTVDKRSIQTVTLR